MLLTNSLTRWHGERKYKLKPSENVVAESANFDVRMTLPLYRNPEQMRRILLLLAIFLLPAGRSFAQYPMPAGYVVLNDANERPLRIEKDVNQDKRNDLVAVMQKGDHVKIVALISKGAKEFRTITHQDPEYFECCSTMEFTKGVLKLTTRGNRYFQTYTFRYNRQLANFELIGYDSESFGNAIHDGAGTLSLNLLTGRFLFSVYTATSETDGKTTEGNRRVKLPKKYTLSNFHEAIVFLEGLKAE